MSFSAAWPWICLQTFPGLNIFLSDKQEKVELEILSFLRSIPHCTFTIDLQCLDILVGSQTSTGRFSGFSDFLNCIRKFPSYRTNRWTFVGTFYLNLFPLCFRSRLGSRMPGLRDKTSFPTHRNPTDSQCPADVVGEVVIQGGVDQSSPPLPGQRWVGAAHSRERETETETLSSLAPPCCQYWTFLDWPFSFCSSLSTTTGWVNGPEWWRMISPPCTLVVLGVGYNCFSPRNWV